MTVPNMASGSVSSRLVRSWKHTKRWRVSLVVVLVHGACKRQVAWNWVCSTHSKCSVLKSSFFGDHAVSEHSRVTPIGYCTEKKPVSLFTLSFMVIYMYVGHYVYVFYT